MENLEILINEGISFMPQVFFNAETGDCNLEGDSHLDDTKEFYKPLHDWLENYTQTGNPISFNFRLSYVNTSSSRQILSILRLLKSYEETGASVDVNWFVEAGDTDTEEDIEDLSIISGLKINKQPK